MSVYSWVTFLCCFVICGVIHSQSIQVDTIIYKGNKRTKTYVIHRELTFDTHQDLAVQDTSELFNFNERRLESLGIFNDAEIFMKDMDGLQVCYIVLVENWYLYPAPIFELSDRNFSEWWVNNNHRLDRVNYGLRLEHINLTGSRDKLAAVFQTGYTKKYELNYYQPFLTKDAKWGVEGFIYYADQKELPYITRNNKLVFGGYNGEKVLRRFRTGTALFYQPNLFASHALRLELHSNCVHPVVIQELNPNYFLNGQTQITFFYLNYFFQYDKRIYPFYPEGGYLLGFNFRKEGLGIFNDYNNTSTFLQLEKYHKLVPKLVVGSKNKLKVNLDRRTVSFANNYALGYREDALVGYDVYVVDGTDYFYSNNHLRYELFNRKLNIDRFMPLEQFKILDLQLFLRANLDVAYVNDPTYGQLNSFSNRLLVGYGPSLDVILYNNYQLNFTYGFNHVGEGRYSFRYQVSF